MMRMNKVTFWDGGIALLEDVPLNAVPREGDGIKIDGNNYTVDEVNWGVNAFGAIVDVYLL